MCGAPDWSGLEFVFVKGVAISAWSRIYANQSVFLWENKSDYIANLNQINNLLNFLNATNSSGHDPFAG